MADGRGWAAMAAVQPLEGRGADVFVVGGGCLMVLVLFLGGALVG